MGTLHPAFTVCVLLFGDYPKLARRCIDSILHRLPPLTYELRIGLNAVSPATRRYVDSLPRPAGAARLYDSADGNQGTLKYPMMRRMFYEQPLTTKYVMWFDDDSFLIGQYVNWLELVVQQLKQASMLGAIWTQQLVGGQADWVRQQPWYTGKEVPANHRVRFCTGGWWATHTAILQQHNWPIPELQHRGGDVMLGELCRQQGYSLLNFREGVAINADEQGRECRSPRRGYDSPPIGHDFRPTAPVLPPPQRDFLHLEI